MRALSIFGFAVVLLFATVPTGPLVSNASAASRSLCDASYLHALQQRHMASQRNCRFPSGYWFWNAAQFRIWCLRQSEQALKNAYNRANSMLLQCARAARPAPSRRTICRRQTGLIMEAIRRSRAKGCIVKGAAAYNLYYTQCIRSPAWARDGVAKWNRYALTCRGQASVERQKTCRLIAQRSTAFMEVARRKGCDVSRAQSYSQVFNACLRQTDAKKWGGRYYLGWYIYAKNCR